MNLNNIQMPQNEDEFEALFRGLSKVMSESLRKLPEEVRLSELRNFKYTDLQLMSLYNEALKNEDYEVCKPVKALLIERGITNIPSEPI
jgi:hypothetical protein